MIRGTTWYKNRFGGDKKNVDESAKDVEQNSAMDPDTLESDESLPEKDLENDEPNEDFQDEEELKDKEEDLATIPKPQQQEEEQLPHGKKLIFWGVTLGFLSGFLGGLVGVRGPPIIIFFLFFSYPKPMVRANGILILLTNVFIRITYYVVEDLTGALERTWFESRLWYLYLCVIFFGMAGVPVGQYAAEKISGSQFKLVLCFMLLLSGLSNLIKGAIDIANR
uniref:Uncharacterized protein n=1 Tax=Helicotheca tamesis TaxID=374047 RepID=A0A7S2I3F8_9STRA